MRAAAQSVRAAAECVLLSASSSECVQSSASSSARAACFAQLAEQLSQRVCLRLLLHLAVHRARSSCPFAPLSVFCLPPMWATQLSPDLLLTGFVCAPEPAAPRQCGVDAFGAAQQATVTMGTGCMKSLPGCLSLCLCVHMCVCTCFTSHANVYDHWLGACITFPWAAPARALLACRPCVCVLPLGQ